MPDETKDQKPPTTTAPDWDKARAHIEKIKQFQLGDVKDSEGKISSRFIGKPGYNPFLWIKQFVTPLEEAMGNEKTRTPELYIRVMGLKEVAPTLETLDKSYLTPNTRKTLQKE